MQLGVTCNVCCIVGGHILSDSDAQGETAAAARKFNKGWDTRLSLLNDCRAHTTALAVYLTACSPEEVLEPLPPWLGFPGQKTQSVDGGMQ